MQIVASHKRTGCTSSTNKQHKHAHSLHWGSPSMGLATLESGLEYATERQRMQKCVPTPRRIPEPARRRGRRSGR